MGRRTLVLVVALLLAAVAAFAVFRFMSGVEAQAEAGADQVEVFRATDLIPAGTNGTLAGQNSIEPDSMDLADRPPAAIGTQEQLAATLTGTVAAGPISVGQVITTDQWVAPNAGNQPLADVIGPGQQAVTLELEPSRAGGGLVQPGDKVNVLVTLDLLVPAGGEVNPASEETAGLGNQDTVEKTLTRFVLTSIKVLAVDENVVSPEDTPQVTQTTLAGATPGVDAQRTILVTLEVNASQAQQLVFSEEAGDVWLSVVPEDFVDSDTQGVVVDCLFSNPGVLGELGIGDIACPEDSEADR